MSHSLTKAQIVTAAQENVGRGSELDAICDVRINLILEEIYESYVHEQQLKTDTTLSFAADATTFTVPTDYIKIKLLKIVDVASNSQQPPTKILEIVPYEDLQSIGVPDAPGIPRLASIIRTLDTTGEPTLSGFIYPKTDKAYTSVTMLYYFDPSFDTADGESVRFFNSSTIVDLLTNYLKGMGYNREGGVPYNPNLLEFIIKKTRRNMADMGIYPTIAKLDRRIFRGRRGPTYPWPRDGGI